MSAATGFALQWLHGVFQSIWLNVWEILSQVKGNNFKNKRVLMEAIHRQKAENIREKAIADQFEARRTKNKQSRERKIARREERLAVVSPVTSSSHPAVASSSPDDLGAL